MSFINEYISKEDRKKYGIDSGLLARNPDLQGKVPEYYQPEWTIDKEREIFIMRIGGVNQAREEGCWQEFILNIKNESIYTFKINRAQGSIQPSDDPFIVIWDKIIEVKFDGVANRNVISILKEALNAFETNNRNAVNLLVIFNFNN